jgi:hypothetical protein
MVRFDEIDKKAVVIYNNKKGIIPKKAPDSSRLPLLQQ